jgi:phosphoglycerate dehydrogenase-like enzyme/predicted dehydrogenase
MSIGTHPAPPLRALVIGAGPAALAMHLPVLARLRDQGLLTLALVCDLRRERSAAAQAQFGFREQTGDGHAALARADIDVVYVFGDARLHYEYGLAALRLGKHLFVEKPVAPTYAQAQELAHAARAAGLVAVGGHNRRFYPSLQRVRAAAGKGGWRLAEAVFHKPEAGRAPLFGARTWLSANGIHALDALVYMMGGLPVRMSSSASSTLATAPATFSALMGWSDGRQGVFLSNNEAGSRREEYVFHAAAETYTVSDAGLAVVRAGGEVQSVAFPAIGAGIAEEHAAFVQSITGHASAPHALAAIVPSLFLCELIEAGFTGEVRLPDEPQPSGPTHEAEQRARVPAVGFAGSLLVSQPAGLQEALLRCFPGMRLVPLAEVRDSTAIRADIGAAILGRGSEALTPEILAKLPGLVIVGIAGLSLAPYAPAALLSRNISVVNAADTYARSLAEFALGLATLGRRRGFTSHELMRRGGWGTSLPPPGLRGLVRRAALRARPLAAALGIETALLRWWRAKQPLGSAPADVPGARMLAGATVGLIGWGASARAFTELLLQAQARVLVFSEHASQAELQEAGAVPAALDQALACDIVSLHRGLTSLTRHFLGAAELARLRPGALFINVARGALVDPAALLARLRRGDVFACLDTFEEEPLVRSHPLRALPNVFLTSHLGGGSADMHAAAAIEVAAKVAASLRGENVQGLSAARLATMS